MYVHGWYQLAFERDLAESITPLAFGDRVLIAVRRGDQVGVYDATCPHRGAHMGFGGLVVDNDVRCPFHHYPVGLGRDSSEGFCVAAYPTMVRGGMVFIRLSESDDIDFPAALDELGTDHAFFPGFEMEVATSIDMVAENGFDSAHFDAVHGMKSRPVFETSDGMLGELVSEGAVELPRTRWFSTVGEPEGNAETPTSPLPAYFRARVFSPGTVIASLTGDPPFNYTIITASSPGVDEGTCTIRLTLALPLEGAPPHDDFAPALLQQSRRGLEQDREIWNRLPPSPPTRYTALDAGVIQFHKFCRKFCD